MESPFIFILAIQDFIPLNASISGTMTIEIISHLPPAFSFLAQARD